MKLAPNSRYAIRILLELDAASGPLPISTLSTKTGISLRAVENVHTILKQNGVTDAIVGAKGGIVLKKTLSEIALGQIVEWFENGVEFTVCCGEKAYDCPQQSMCLTKSSWQGISMQMQKSLNAISLAAIFKRTSDDDILL